MDSLSAELAEVRQALLARPRVLILGQSNLGPSPTNPLVAAISTLRPDGDAYQWWLESPLEPTARAARLNQVEGSATLPAHDRSLRRVPWAAVYTSDILGLTRRSFEIPHHRQVKQIFVPGFDQASRGATLSLIRLFGTTERQIEDELPPLTSQALRRRRAGANDMLLTLPELTKRGHVFIDGWDSKVDWLRPRDLTAGLLRMSKGQVHLFGVDTLQLQALSKDDEDFAGLLADGIVVPHEGTLAHCYAEITQKQPIAFEGTIEDEAEFVTCSVVADSRDLRSPPDPSTLVSIRVSRMDWRRLHDDNLHLLAELDPSMPLPPAHAEQVELFRSFVASGVSDSQHRWLDALTYKREALSEAVGTCLQLAGHVSPQDHTVLVVGQSGSGKTVLLHQLALALRRHGLPVVIATRGLLPLNRRLVEDLCERIADVSSAPVFLIYDGTLDDEDYVSLSTYLSSISRKCVVVGSCHQSGLKGIRTGQKTKAKIRIIDLPVELSEATERDGLATHLARFMDHSQEELRRLLEIESRNFFAVLFRFMDTARPRLRAGIIQELEAASEQMRRDMEAARKGGALLPRSATAVEHALRRAFGDELDVILGRAIELSGSTQGEAREIRRDAALLMDAVMLSSRIPQLWVPLDLVLRLVNHHLLAYRLLPGDVISEREEDGVVLLAARLPLEAQIWVATKLPSQADQFKVIRELVLKIQASEVRNDRSPALEFIVGLLHGIGPQGTDFKMPAFYGKIAELIGELRDRHRVVHPRLLLLQAHAVRKAVGETQTRLQKEEPPPSDQDRRKAVAEFDRQLLDAERGLELAFNLVEGEGTAPRQLRSTLETERAGVLGFRIGSLGLLPQRDRQTTDLGLRATELYRKARSAWRAAIGLSSSNYRPVDTACWVAKDRLDLGEIRDEDAVDLIADWREAIDHYNELELPPSQYDKRDEREAEFSRATYEKARLSAVLDRAKARGSNAVNALIARWMADEGSDRRAARLGARWYLEKECGSSLLTDRHVLLLYMRLWWQTETGQDAYIPRERFCIPFGREQWERLGELIQARQQLEGEAENPIVLLLKACALLHLDQAQDADRILERLSGLRVGGNWRSRSVYLLSDAEGRPRELHAEYQKKTRGRTSLAWCDELRINVPFLPEDWEGVRDTGDMLGPFHLAIRYRGLLADRPGRYESR